MKLLCFVFPVLCYLAGREVIIITPFIYKSIQFPKVSQRTFKTKGLISIEGTFLGHPVHTVAIYRQQNEKFRSHASKNIGFPITRFPDFN